MLNFSLTPEQLALQKKVRDFAIKEILPYAWHYDETDTTPIHIIRKAYDAGLMNGNIPKKYGGREMGLIEACITVEEIAAADAGIATSIFDNSLGLEPVILCANEAVKEKYLPLILNGFKLICYATSEAMMGSDVAGMRCQAVKDGDDYILNGTKYWITNAGIADYFSIFATVDPALSHKGICAFLVEKDWEGVSTGIPIEKLGQRSSNTAAVKLVNVRVPKENILAEPGEGFGLAMRTFSMTRPPIGAFGVGAARSAMEFAIDYAKKRRAFGQKIANFEAIQFKFAEMYQKIETARLLTMKAAWEADSGIDPTINASISKFYGTEIAFEVANTALQIFGGYGYTRFYPIEKLLRDIRVLSIYEGTSEIQRVIVSGFVLNSYVPAMPPIEDIPRLHGDTEPDHGRNETVWRCRICGHIHYGDNPPEECPNCFFPESSYKKVWPV
ncbi:MAG: acyl-CoA dehydrogenase [Spirochaetae bacterium HGW-Spirochaetae-5]|nr:MAG: acyl-CoA dehydrogenase [Spirochaetae bacterium HGW-Spirochaetae-5]